MFKQQHIKIARTRTDHWSAFGDLVVHGLLDDSVDVRLVRLSPISRIRPNDACSLSRDPVGDAASRCFRIDLPASMTALVLVLGRSDNLCQ